MAHKIWQHQAASGDTVRSRRTFEAFTDQGDDTRLKSIGLAQAVFDELIDVMPDLVWVNNRGVHSAQQPLSCNRYVICQHSDEDVWDLALDSLGSFTYFDTLGDAKVGANNHRRACWRAIWETEE